MARRGDPRRWSWTPLAAPVALGALLLLTLALLSLPAPTAQAATLDACADSWVAPTPTKITPTKVPIEVTSTTADYFVLYVKHERTSGNFVDIPVSVTRGKAGTTTLSDNLKPLPASSYRVEKYQVATPADIDGDCIDDISELKEPGVLSPVNPATGFTLDMGRFEIDSHDTFQTISYKGDYVLNDPHLTNLEYVKFWILNFTNDITPEVYFMHTHNHRGHSALGRFKGWDGQWWNGSTRGQIVYHPNAIAPDGTLGVYRFEFDNGRRPDSFDDVAYANELLAAAMPALTNNLAYYPLATWANNVGAYNRAKTKYDASRVNVLLDKDIMPEVAYIPLNQAEGFGRLRVMEEGERPGPYDIAIFTSLPNDLPRVAGAITTVPQTPLAHINLRAIQNGLPNAFIRDALTDPVIKPLIGKYVYFAVLGNRYLIREATKKEVDDHHAKLRPTTTQTLTSDLTVTAITALSDITFDDWDAFGVKAANMAELSKLPLPAGTVPTGYAVPFYFYDQFMKNATVAEDSILGKKKWDATEKVSLPAGTTLAKAVELMLANTHFQSDYDAQEEMLDDLRDLIKEATAPAWIIKALETMHAKYPEGQSLRYRSSTNNEDLQSFNGAGLYSSKTQDPDETEEDGIDKSIKGVWASLWNFRAFLERDFYRVDHNSVYMGVLVHPNYQNEKVNGSRSATTR